MKTVLIGIAPAHIGEEGQPLSPITPRSTGHRLSQMMKLSAVDYLTTFDRVNICPFHQSGGIRIMSWVPAAENLAGSILRHRRVILLGPNVAECFGIKRVAYDYCVWSGAPAKMAGVAGWRIGATIPFTWAVLPHPSGRNCWYRTKFNKELAITFLNEAKQLSMAERNLP